MAGLADTKGHLTKTYQYTVTGELAYGSATYENEYTYNGESYNPNVHSQYLRARYYSVVTASFLTEDSYLGNIREPLTLNRYNYCISSYLNYVDPSGNRLIPQDARDEIQKLVGRDYYIPRIQGVRDKILDALGLNGFHLEMLPSMREGKTIPPMWTPTYGVERDGNGAWMDGGIGAFLNNIKCEHDAEYYLQIAAERAEENRRNETCDMDDYELRAGWLKLYKNPTISLDGHILRQVELADSGHKSRWCNHEYPYKKETAYINPNAYEQMMNAGVGVVSNIVERNFIVNEEGRYWVAVGPKVLVSDYPDTGKVRASEFVYGTKLDVQVYDQELDQIFYIPAVVGDVKNHTYPNGMYHTGIPYPKSADKTTAKADYSYIEFIRTNEDENSPFGGLGLYIEGIIVYERDEYYCET